MLHYFAVIDINSVIHGLIDYNTQDTNVSYSYTRILNGLKSHAFTSLVDLKCYTARYCTSPYYLMNRIDLGFWL